jgi:hypothetical protein
LYAFRKSDHTGAGLIASPAFLSVAILPSIQLSAIQANLKRAKLKNSRYNVVQEWRRRPNAREALRCVAQSMEGELRRLYYQAAMVIAAILAGLGALTGALFVKART